MRSTPVVGEDEATPISTASGRDCSLRVSVALATVAAAAHDPGVTAAGTATATGTGGMKASSKVPSTHVQVTSGPTCTTLTTFALAPMVSPPPQQLAFLMLAFPPSPSPAGNVSALLPAPAPPPAPLARAEEQAEDSALSRDFNAFGVQQML